MIKQLQIKDIRTDGGTQHRPLDEGTVLKYAALIAEKREFEKPIEVVYDGTDNWLVDGFHRLEATKKNKIKTIEAEVSEGTQREAIWFSLSVNGKHGLPRQPGSVKKMLLEIVFPDPEWSKDTDAGIAQWVGVTRQYVWMCRKEYDNGISGQDESDLSSVDNSIPDSEPEPEVEPEIPPAEEPEAPQVLEDNVGRVIPVNRMEVFQRVGEIRELVNQATRILKTCRDAVEAEDPLFAFCKTDQLKAAITNVRSILRFIIPYAVCPVCGGDVNNDMCRQCNGNGFVNDRMYANIPPDIKE